MPLVEEMEDVLKLVEELPDYMQKIAAKKLRSLVLFHEERETMTWEEQKALHRLRKAEFIATTESAIVRLQKLIDKNTPKGRTTPPPLPKE